MRTSIALHPPSFAGSRRRFRRPRRQPSMNALFVRFVLATLLVLLLLGLAATAHGQKTAILNAIKTKPSPAKTSLDAYLNSVHAASAGMQPAAGAIWTEGGRLNRFTADVRAMQPHDLISVIVSEALASSTDGTVKGSRSSSANASITSLLTKLSAASSAANLLSRSAASALNAQGQSANNSSLTTTLGGEVVEVLPNGILVIEAARQVEFSQQTQTIVLRGLVRPEDITQQNEVRSTAIASLELQVRGNGVVTDYTHRPNVLVRMLERALIF